MAHQRRVHLEDERGRGFPVVIQYGPYIFVGGSDGHRTLATETIDPELANNAVEQCRNSYGRLQQRLVKAGFSGRCAVWIQNFTSGQHWRLERMAQWPDFFGEVEHGYAVSFGAQTHMSGINMLTSCVLAVTPDVERHVAVKQPTRGRASRITRVGPLVFVIGVRGHADPDTGEHAPEETADAFDIQLDACFKTLASHLRKDGTPFDNIVRVDTALRGARFIPRYLAGAQRHFDGRVPFAGYAIGTILGARCEHEIGAVAVAAGEQKRIWWSPADAGTAEATAGGGLVFLRNCSGLRDETKGVVLRELHGRGPEQVKQAVANVRAILNRAGTGLDALLRLDVFVRDIYAEDEIVAALKAALGPAMPVLNVIGTEPAHGAELELTAIAGSAA